MYYDALKFEALQDTACRAEDEDKHRSKSIAVSQSNTICTAQHA